MPSVSRGLYRWIFKGSAILEDFADRLNHFWTVGLLLILACVISWKHGYNKPINCLCPHQFPSSMVQYSESLCWDSHIIQYYRDLEKASEKLNVSFGRMIPSEQPFVSHAPIEDDADLLVKESSTTTLYQWLPMILCFQALLFKLPNIILYVMHSYAGISFDKIASLTSGYENLNLKERQVLSSQIARYILQWCRQLGSCLPWRFLTLLWLAVKLLFCINIVVQMIIVDGFLRTTDPPLDNSTSFGQTILSNLFENNASLWKTSPAFPRQVFCSFTQSIWQNLQEHSIQCHLPANAFNERVFMFIWVWLLFVAVVTLLNLVSWVLRTLVPVFRRRYITKLLEATDCLDLNTFSPFELNKFCDVIGEDGVMVLKLTSANSSELMVKDVVCNMWKLKYGDKKRSFPDGAVICPEVEVGYMSSDPEVGAVSYIPLTKSE